MIESTFFRALPSTCMFAGLKIKTHSYVFEQRHHIKALLYRNYIYEDAFDKLSPDNEANLRLKMRVQLVNAAGRERIYL